MPGLRRGKATAPTQAPGTGEAMLELRKGLSGPYVAASCAWASAGRRTPRALTGRPWHIGRAGCLDGGKKTGGSQGTRSGKAKRRLPFTPTAFLPDWRGFGGALQGAGRALTDCRLPVFGRASENQGLRWGSLAHRPGLGRGRGRASIGATEKRRGAVKGRAAAKRSDVYPLRRPLFCQTGRGQRSEGATKGAGPDQGLSWEAEHRPSADGGGLGEAGRRAGLGRRGDGRGVLPGCDPARLGWVVRRSGVTARLTPRSTPASVPATPP